MTTLETCMEGDCELVNKFRGVLESSLHIDQCTDFDYEYFSYINENHKREFKFHILKEDANLENFNKIIYGNEASICEVTKTENNEAVIDIIIKEL